MTEKEREGRRVARANKQNKVEREVCTCVCTCVCAYMHVCAKEREGNRRQHSLLGGSARQALGV